METQTPTSNSEAKKDSLTTKVGRVLTTAGAIAMIGGSALWGYSDGLWLENKFDLTHLPANHYREASTFISDIQNPSKIYGKELAKNIAYEIACPFAFGGSLMLGLGIGALTTYKPKENSLEKMT